MSDVSCVSEARAAVEQLIREAGFDSVGVCAASSLKVLEEVRDMCAADRCRAYGRSWSCPPACGSLDQFAALFARYQDCIVFQTTLPLEDDFDYEGMVAAKALHDKRSLRLAMGVLDSGHDVSLLGAGSCMLCGEDACTCPDEPCVNPELMHPSMEAAGLWVSEVCKTAGVPYNHGPQSMTYTSCALV
ncbi:MAG: DUF2284 domain-containing protein [Coriobacteriales bacterium]|jgi:predicted metal-binding protein|nr:DUF2284 domain-containing protein [Coriobacteriales bacterium]